jgi:hypothetical protein
LTAIATGEPLVLEGLPQDDRREFLRSAVAAAKVRAEVPGPGRDAAFDAQLVREENGNPLTLLLATLASRVSAGSCSALIGAS